ALRLLCYTLHRMADKNDSVLDKAEQLARRVLERLGSKVDSKLGGGAEAALSHREVSELTSRIEREIDASLRPDGEGVKRVAPNRVRVGFTYERASEMSDEYFDALAKELKGAAYEFIANRRYTTLAPFTVEVGSDLFAKSTVVRAQFEGDAAGADATTVNGQSLTATEVRPLSQGDVIGVGDLRLTLAAVD